MRTNRFWNSYCKRTKGAMNMKRETKVRISALSVAVLAVTVLSAPMGCETPQSTPLIASGGSVSTGGNIATSGGNSAASTAASTGGTVSTGGTPPATGGMIASGGTSASATGGNTSGNVPVCDHDHLNQLMPGTTNIACLPYGTGYDWTMLTTGGTTGNATSTGGAIASGGTSAPATGGSVSTGGTTCPANCSAGGSTATGTGTGSTIATCVIGEVRNCTTPNGPGTQTCLSNGTYNACGPLPTGGAITTGGTVSTGGATSNGGTTASSSSADKYEVYSFESAHPAVLVASSRWVPGQPTQADLMVWNSPQGSFIATTTISADGNYRWSLVGKLIGDYNVWYTCAGCGTNPAVGANYGANVDNLSHVSSASMAWLTCPSPGYDGRFRLNLDGTLQPAGCGSNL